jgi:hypothetical protein
MKRCPSCNYENPQTSSYCERCGSFLPSTTDYTDPEAYLPTYRASNETPAPPPPYGYETPVSQYQVPAAYQQPEVFGYQPVTAVPQPRRRSGGATTLSVLLFLWGVFCTAFGLAGGIIHEASDTIIGLVFIGTCLVGLIVMLPILIARKNPYLRSGRRFLIAIGISILAGLAILIGVGALPLMLHFTDTPLQYYILGAVLVVYGFALTLLANW